MLGVEPAQVEGSGNGALWVRGLHACTASAARRWLHSGLCAPGPVGVARCGGVSLSRVQGQGVGVGHGAYRA